ncbi:MAG: tRNA pseudouridine(55) synthase TruB [Planctomycetota bacterium]|nr:tRNA pseudouridine(55) synthase TruB [Planctomycetota bacterium]
MMRADKPADPGLAGVLVVDKPSGPTSMQVVAAVRRRAGGERTGHAGTLDPLATGVLVLALGRATKIIDRLMATEKRYRTRIDLSAFTSTDDLEGERGEVSVPRPPAEADIRAAFDRFTGEFLQRPPAHSAVKVGGRRAYKLARRGRPPTLEPRPVTIHDINLLEFDWPFIEIDLRCGKGLYVRALARDLGEALGTGGHCVSIRRTAVGPFTLDMARPPDTLPEPLAQADLMPIDEALALTGSEPEAP